MKKIQCALYSLLAGAMIYSACGKADVITFSDKSTIKKADRSGWTVTASSQEVTCEAAGVALLLDGNINTFWHTDYCGTNPPYPHWVNIDMKNALGLVSIDITARQNNANGMNKFKIEGSADGNTWFTLRDTTAFVGATKTPQSFAVPSSKPTRFIKVTAISGPTGNTFLAEIEAFTAK